MKDTFTYEQMGKKFSWSDMLNKSPAYRRALFISRLKLKIEVAYYRFIKLITPRHFWE
jgi:hypothetical protein